MLMNKEFKDIWSFVCNTGSHQINRNNMKILNHAVADIKPTLDEAYIAHFI